VSHDMLIFLSDVVGMFPKSDSDGFPVLGGE
jgi:hypothetical protein